MITPAVRADLARLIARILYDRYLAKHPEQATQPGAQVARPPKQAQNPGA